MQVDAVYQHLAVRRALVAGEHVQQCRLAGTAGSHNANQSALLFRQVDVAQADGSVFEPVFEVVDIVCDFCRCDVRQVFRNHIAVVNWFAFRETDGAAVREQVNLVALDWQAVEYQLVRAEVFRKIKVNTLYLENDKLFVEFLNLDVLGLFKCKFRIVDNQDVRNIELLNGLLNNKVLSALELLG